MTSPSQPDVTLRPITRDNWRDCVLLKVAPSQRDFVASNEGSLAQAAYETEWMPRAIYADETMVGFVMYGRAEDDHRYWILRLMIGSRYQGQGYGRAGLGRALDQMRADPNCSDIYISYEPENTPAERLYLSMGFESTGEIIEGEKVARLRVNR